MFCNWTIHYEPETVRFDEETGDEPGARYRLVSDWDDDFEVVARPATYATLPEWCRAEDQGVVPAYFWDVLPDLTGLILNQTITSGTHGYQVDLATRTGNQTARELWAIENPG